MDRARRGWGRIQTQAGFGRPEIHRKWNREASAVRREADSSAARGRARIAGNRQEIEAARARFDGQGE